MSKLPNFSKSQNVLEPTIKIKIKIIKGLKKIISKNIKEIFYMKLILFTS